MIGTEEASIAWEKGNQKPGQHFRRRPQQTLRPVNTLTRIAEFAPRAITTLERVDIAHLEAWQLDSVNFSVDRRLASGESEDITTLREMVAAELIAAKTAGAYWRP
jgi:hypothetical protein